MIVTVIWEDQRGGPQKGFGPHELICQCIADQRGCDKSRVSRVVKSVPCKGNGNVLRVLSQDGPKLQNSGPVLVVLDLDRAHELLGGPELKDCKTALSQALRGRASGSYEILYLDRNVDTIVALCCRLLGRAEPDKKLTPDERDAELARLTFGGDPSARRQLLGESPSFARVVAKIAAVLPPSALDTPA